MAPNLVRFLERRLSAYLKTRPAAVVDEVRGYFRAGEPTKDASRSARADRYWTLLPGWLLRHPRFAARAHADRGFLRDVLWGQYCLFLFIRIHDDLLDGQAHSPALLFVADSLLVESERSLAKHLQRAPFWELFRDLLDTTLRAVLDVDALQRRPGGMRLETLGKYGDVSAIFRVGSAAVCAKCRRMDDFQHVSAFAHHLAVANQIVDDVRDVQEDLDRGRFNFAATHFGLDGVASPAEHNRAIGRSVLLDDGIGSLIALVKGHYDAALAEIQLIGLDPAAAFVKRAQRKLARFAREVHRSRVRYLLAPVIPSL